MQDCLLDLVRDFKTALRKENIMVALTKKLVVLIQNNSDKLTKRTMADLKKHPGAKSYRSLTEDELYSRIAQVYNEFDKWMLNKIKKENIKNTFMAIGKQRREEGFELSEVIQALTILRRHIWLLVDSESFFDTALDLHMAIDLINQTLVFFDRAIYFTALGYEKN